MQHSKEYIKTVEFLYEAGFSALEADVYITILETGPIKVTNLSRTTQIPKTTLYRVLEKLMENGLISQVIKGSEKMYIPENARRIQSLLTNQKVEFENKLTKIDGLLKKFPGFLNTLPSETDNSEFNVKFYEGRNSVKLIYQEALEAKEFRAFLNAQKLNKYFPENVDMFLAAHKKRKDMHIWEVMERSQGSIEYAKRIPKERYYCKFVPEGMHLSVIDYMIFDGKVAIVNLTEDTSGTILINQNYYENAKAIYDFVWQMLPEPKLD